MDIRPMKHRFSVGKFTSSMSNAKPSGNWSSGRLKWQKPRTLSPRPPSSRWWRWSPGSPRPPGSSPGSSSWPSAWRSGSGTPGDGVTRGSQVRRLTVTVARRPSGTLATMMPIRKMTASS
ncbi:unnamed protein product, partial [Menidia menidia]